MSTIKFRGKMSDGGRWLYGSLLTWPDGDVYILHDVNYTTSGTLNKDPVLPDTVGQFTGLTDKNGKEIYEGDIVQCGDFVYQVVYEGKRYASFVLIRSGDLFMHYFGEAMEASECTVIGNSCDNPELLKQTTNQTN